MTSLTPTSTHHTGPRPDPSDLLYLALTLRFGSSAYLASDRFLASRQRPEPEPPTALRALPAPSRTPRLIVGQVLDRMAA
jgi:hypothetical protein